MWVGTTLCMHNFRKRRKAISAGECLLIHAMQEPGRSTDHGFTLWVVVVPVPSIVLHRLEALAFWTVLQIAVDGAGTGF